MDKRDEATVTTAKETQRNALDVLNTALSFLNEAGVTYTTALTRGGDFAVIFDNVTVGDDKRLKIAEAGDRMKALINNA